MDAIFSPDESDVDDDEEDYEDDISDDSDRFAEEGEEEDRANDGGDEEDDSSHADDGALRGSGATFARAASEPPLTAFSAPRSGAGTPPLLSAESLNGD